MCIPMTIAIKLICIYEMYHFYTQYQPFYFIFGFKPFISTTTFAVFLVVFIFYGIIFLAAAQKFIAYLINS